MPRLWLAAALGAAVIGCGDDSSNGPNASFPDVAGTYDVEGTFDGIEPDRASFTGTVTLEQESLESSLLTGTASLTFSDSTPRTLTISNAVEDASVTLAGVVVFTVVSEGQDVTWEFSGERGGDVLDGDHTMTEGGTSRTGEWIGER
jgi:hypothetical protein